MVATTIRGKIMNRHLVKDYFVITMWSLCLLLAAGANAAQPLKLDVCHAPPGNPENTQNIKVGIKGKALVAHMAHGDWLVTDEMCDSIADNNCDRVPDPNLDDADCVAINGGEAGWTCEAGECVPPLNCPDGKPIELVFEYTGQGCEGNPANSQDGKFTCSGDPGAADPVQLVVEDANADPSTEIISVGDFVSITPSGVEFDAQTDFEIKQGGVVLHDLSIHLSCSQDLNVGDRFGSLILRVFVPAP